MGGNKQVEKMNEEEYKEKLKSIELDYETKKKQLYYDYALSNAKFKVGDLIKDERWMFVVDKITAYKFHSLPLAVYHGFELKKDLTRKKNNNRVCIHGNDAELIHYVP